MRVARIALALTLIFLAGRDLRGQQPTVAAQRDPQALSLLSQCGAAMGADLITDSYATGTVTESDLGAPVGTIISQTKGFKTRNDISTPNGQQSFVAGDGTGWLLRGGKKANAPRAAVAYSRPEYVPALSCVIDVLRPNMSVRYLGLEKSGTSSVYHIEFNVPPSGEDNTETLLSDFHVYLDQQTFLVVKTSILVFDPNALENHSVWETYYGNYRPMSGALVAFHVENFLAGQKVNDIVFTDIQINHGVSDAIFN